MTNVYATLAIALLALAAAAPLSPLAAQRQLRAGEVREGELSFDGRASVGDFVGRTRTLRGQMGGGALPAVTGWVEAPVSTLETGNGRRDRDLRKSMEVEQYPTMRFDLQRAVPDDPAATADSIGAVLEGTLTIHGVRRQVSLPATLLFQGNAVRVRSSFPLDLKDYKIGGLSKMLGILRMYEDIVVHVDVLFGVR